MKFYKFFGFVVAMLHIIPNGSAMEPHILMHTEDSTPINDENFIETMLQRLGKKHNDPVNIREVYATLDNSQQRIEVITDLIVSQHPSSSNDNILSLLSTVRDVFNTIGESTNLLEGSLNGIVGCVDLGVLDVQIALHVLIEAFISNCDDAEERSDGAIVSAVYCLSLATKTLITSMSDLADKIINSTEIFDGNTITGIQAIVQTVLSIVDRVVRTLKYINILDLENVEPNLDKLALVINRLANQRFNLIPKMSDEMVAPILEITDSLRSMVGEISNATDKNIAHLVESLSNIQDKVPEKQLIPAAISLLNEIQPNFSSLSNAIHSMPGITDSVAYSTDISLQNLMAISKCLSYYITLLVKAGPTQNLTDLGSNLQTILCFVASIIQTLVEGIILTVERALMDLICTSPTIDKLVLDRQLQELQALIEPMLLTFENIVRPSIEIIQNLLSVGACTIGDVIDAKLMEDMNRLIRNLARLSNGMKLTVSSIQLLSDTLPLNDGETMTDENTFSICIRSFEKVAHNAMDVRFYFIKSVEHIRKYLADLSV